jgi:hypothetical protein
VEWAGGSLAVECVAVGLCACTGFQVCKLGDTSARGGCGHDALLCFAACLGEEAPRPSESQGLPSSQISALSL